MRTTYYLMIGLCLGLHAKQLQAQFPVKAIEPANASQIITTTLSGPDNVCANDQNTVYWGTTNFSGLNYWVEFKCGGSGVITESGTQTYIIYNTGNSNSCHVNWGNYNASTSWVQVTYHWTAFFTNYSSLDIKYVNIGMIGDPNSLSGPSSICSDDFSNYTISCPTPLPVGGQGYQWSVSNAAIVSGGTSNTITLHATNANPIVVSVKFISPCGSILTGVFYSNSYSYTISRLPGKPFSPGYVPNMLLSLNTSNDLLVSLTWPSLPSSYNWNCSIISSSGTTNYPGSNGGNVGFTVPNSAQLILTANYGNGCSGNTYSYVNSRGILRGGEQRIGHFDTEDQTLKTDNNLTVYPTPATSELNIGYVSEEASSISIVLNDMLGNTVMKQEIQLVEGQNDLNFQLSELPNGIYLVNVSGKNFSETRKIVIAN